MKKMSFALTIGILWLLFSIAFHHPNAIGQTDLPVYDLSICIQKALQKHPTLLESQNKIKYYEHGVDLAKSEFGPHLSGYSYAIEYKSNREFAIFSTMTGSDFVSTDSQGTDYVAGLKLSQPIYKSGSFLGLLGFYAPSIEREKNNVASQKYTDSKLRADAIFNVIDAYGQVLKALHALKIAEEGLKTNEFDYEVALAKYKHNLITTSQLLETEKPLFQQRAKIEGLSSLIETNLGILSNRVGQSEKISKISEDLSSFRKVVYDEKSLPPLEKLCELASQKRNNIKAQEAKIQSIQHNLKVVNSKRYPEINLGANYFYRGDFSDSHDKTYGWNVFLRLDWNLFDFGETSASVAQQKDLILAQKETLRALKNDMVSEVQSVYQTILSLKAKLTSIKKSIEQAKEVLALTEEKYKKVFVTEVDVMKARDQLIQVEQIYYETEVDLIVYHVALKKAIGLDIPVSYGL